MKPFKTETGRFLYLAIVRVYGKCKFSADELENAIDLAIRRGAEGRQIIKEAINFLYS